MLSFFVKLGKIVQIDSHQLILFFRIPLFYLLQSCMGKHYPSSLERISLIQKKLARIITCSPFRAHTEPLYFANKILNVCDNNDYIIGTFMYECLNGNIPDIFRSYFQRNAAVHDHNLRNANDLHVPYGRLDIRKFSIRVTGANLWDSLPMCFKNSQSINIFKNNMRHYLIEKKNVYLKVSLIQCTQLTHISVSQLGQHRFT